MHTFCIQYSAQYSYLAYGCDLALSKAQTSPDQPHPLSISRIKEAALRLLLSLFSHPIIAPFPLSLPRCWLNPHLILWLSLSS